MIKDPSGIILPHLECITTIPCENLSVQKIDLIIKHRHSSKTSNYKLFHRPASQRQWSRLLQHHNSLLPSTHQISHEFFIFQHDSAPAHKTCKVVNFL